VRIRKVLAALWASLLALSFSHYFTLLSLGFFFLALAEAWRVELARIAPAAPFDTPSLAAILACTALKPGWAAI